MKTACMILWFLMVAAAARADGEYDFAVTGDGLLPPAREDAYGPGVGMDQFGRPVERRRW